MNQAPISDRPHGLIERITDASGRNPLLIGLLSLIAAGVGFYALTNISLDAVPDLSDVQVIVDTNWEGRSPHPDRRPDYGSHYQSVFGRAQGESRARSVDVR